MPGPRRLIQLYAGLALYGFSDAMILGARIGADPWDVFHQGLARQSGMAVGTSAIIVGAVVLLLWIPLRQRPGIGTVSNVVVIGTVINLALPLMPPSPALGTSFALLIGGVVLNGVATGAYIGAGLGPGPRDGLMTGYAARGHSIRAVRTVIELTVLSVGFLLGGTVGIGTVVYALAIGPLAHVFIPLLKIGRPRRGSARAVSQGA
ncbi:MAG: YitT family protein [Candidatus Dormibacteria bacterium]